MKPSRIAVDIPRPESSGIPQIDAFMGQTAKALRALANRGRREPQTIQQSGAGSTATRFPLEVYSRIDSNGDTELVATPSSWTHDNIPIAETTTVPAIQFDYYLVAEVTVNSSTGAISNETVAWQTSAASGANERDIAKVTINASSDPVEVTGITQYTYGPLFAFAHGSASDAWVVEII